MADWKLLYEVKFNNKTEFKNSKLSNKDKKIFMKMLRNSNYTLTRQNHVKSRKFGKKRMKYTYIECTKQKVEELGFISYWIYFGGCSKCGFKSVTLTDKVRFKKKQEV